MDAFDTEWSPGFLIPHYLEHHGREQPAAPALEYREQRISYSELAARARQLAGCLLQHATGRGDRVGIHMDKSLELGIALHGIMRAGAAYVPLDSSAPADRVAQMIRDCGIRIVIAGANKRDKLRDVARQLDYSLLVVGIDGDDDNFDTLSWSDVAATGADKLPAIKLLEDDLAYIIYTSGSTGTPKGIMHSHHSSLSYSRWAATEYGLHPGDRLGNHAALHFDISIFDFIAGVVAGACVVMIPEECLKFPASYSQLLADSEITVLFTVPFALIQLTTKGVLEERDLASLRWLIFGGEPMPVKHLAKLQEQIPGAVFDNMYGPAEVNGVTHYTVPTDLSAKNGIPIGPINQIAEALVVNADLQPVQPGTPGELLVRSPSMMLGYWRRPDLNSAAIVEVDFGNAIPMRYYRTGDLVREETDGTLWFLGRGDRQVKVRGYRVELDELEAVLTQHCDVELAAAYAISNDDGAVEIGMTILPHGAMPVDVASLQRYLKQQLPAYAVPRQITVADEMPRTTTGKIDRQALSRSNSR